MIQIQVSWDLSIRGFILSISWLLQTSVRFFAYQGSIEGSWWLIQRRCSSVPTTLFKTLIYSLRKCFLLLLDSFWICLFVWFVNHLSRLSISFLIFLLSVESIEVFQLGIELSNYWILKSPTIIAKLFLPSILSTFAWK